MVSANVVANSILKRAFNEKIPVTPMKLQKLLYLVFKKFHQDTGMRLFNEDFMTWKYGPVVESVYDEFKAFRANEITKFSKDSKGNAYVVDENSGARFVEAVNCVWAQYKDMDGIKLSTLTHQRGTAWDKAIQSGSPVLKLEDITVEPPLYNFL